jgi:glutathionyl-hydroquinone reductase
MGEHGWPFASKDAFVGADDDPLYGSGYVKDLYLRANPDYHGRCVWSVPSFSLLRKL